ncbi:hypothetical protein JW992_12945, partial [candidate division KSB1 bacterium]|nr:hypothetical protein [candidate division KSB1 bacterium]
LGEQDHRFVEMTRPFAGIRYAISYVRDAAEMQHYRELLGRDLYLIAKLERKSAVTQARQLADSADELWLCRGDLGAELGFRALAETARRFAAQVPSLPLPVLLAGQVLEHLSEHSTPTRAELCNLYDSLCSGYHGVVLSDETAVGQYPIESCRIAALFRDSSGAETNRNILA